MSFPDVVRLAILKSRESEPLEIITADSLADSPADLWYMFYFVTTVTH